MKLKVAIPCVYYTEIEVDIQDKSLIEDLKNNVVENLDINSPYMDEILNELEKDYKRIESFENFSVDSNLPTLFWIE